MAVDVRVVVADVEDTVVEADVDCVDEAVEVTEDEMVLDTVVVIVVVAVVVTVEIAVEV